MTYPAGIENLTTKSDGPKQVIAASHMNALKTSLDEVQAILGDAPQGSLSDVESRLDVLIGDDGKLQDISNTLFVGKSGCKYTTIQSAIDSISDASTANQYVVIVFPGIYTETITMKSCVHVSGIIANIHPKVASYSQLPVKVLAPSGQNALIAASSTVSNILFESDTATDMILCPSGYPVFANCYFHQEANAKSIYITDGYASFIACFFRPESQYAFNIDSAVGIFDRCIIRCYDENSAWLLSSASTLYLNFCEIDSCETRSDVPSGCTLQARLCQFSAFPTGSGTIGLGTLSGSCSDSIAMCWL